jgi:LytS/YehU family sensor histidine kinase
MNGSISLISLPLILALSGLSAYLLIRHFRNKKLVEQLIIEHELKAYRAQLDPHMLQNTFEIMAAHIMNETPDTAISFIHKISAYLRQVLYTSDKSIVSLEEELEFTEKYLSVQKSVTNDLFKYTISVDDEIDTLMDVPSMLFQPVLENSIKHGFANTSVKNGLIDVRLEQQDNYIICTLSDNGAGLSKAPGSPKPFSKGLQLTEKRMHLLYKTFKHRPTIEVINNESRGVSTILRRPIL